MIIKLNEILNNHEKYFKLIPEFFIYLDRISSIELKLLNNCSCKCFYCYNNYLGDIPSKEENNKIIKKEYAISAIREFKKIIDFKNKYKDLYNFNNLDLENLIEFFGGEPLLLAYYHKNLLEEIIKETIKNGFKISMPTNGRYGKKINSEIMDILKKYNEDIYLSFSIDGEAYINDKQRQINKNFFINNNLELPTYEDFYDFVNLCKEYKIDYSFHPMLTPYTIKNPNKFFDFFKDLLSDKEYKHFGLLAVRNCNLFNFNTISYEDAKKFGDIAAEYYLKYGNKNWLFDFPEHTLGFIELSNKRYWGCSIFNCIYFNQDGKVNLCHRYELLNDKRKFYELGYIENEELYLNINKICTWVKSYKRNKKEKCKNCLFLGSCGSDCLAHTSEIYENVNIMNDSVCYANKISMFIGFYIANKIHKLQKNGS